MLKTLAPFGVAGLALAALAAGAPSTAHAAGSGGPCSGAGTGHPVQHTGDGKHSFTDSHNNCVKYVGTGDTVYLTDSNFNLVNMLGSHDTIRDFRNSDSNTITFDTGANYDTLTASNSNNNVIEFTATAVNDFVTLMGLTNNTGITISGYNDYLLFTAGCGTGPQTYAFNNQGTKSNPIKVC